MKRRLLFKKQSINFDLHLMSKSAHFMEIKKQHGKWMKHSVRIELKIIMEASGVSRSEAIDIEAIEFAGLSENYIDAPDE